MTSIYPGMDFKHAALLRVYQSIGFPFLFVPIQTIAYVGVSLSDNNQVSGMTNLARNMGGSVGISVVTTLIARRAQAHQKFLAWHTGPANSIFTQSVSALENALRAAGLSSYEATQQAYARIYQSVQAQAQTLGYIDTFYILAIIAVMMVPLVFLAQKTSRVKPAWAIDVLRHGLELSIQGSTLEEHIPIVRNLGRVAEDNRDDVKTHGAPGIARTRHEAPRGSKNVALLFTIDCPIGAAKLR